MAEHAIVSRYNYSQNKRQYYLLVYNGNWYLRPGTVGGAGYLCVSSPASADLFSCVMGVYRQAENKIELYVNGVLGGTADYYGSMPGFAQTTAIGKLFGTPVAAQFSGIIDEVHLADTARSAGWIKTCYNNQSSPQTFYTVEAIGGEN